MGISDSMKYVYDLVVNRKKQKIIIPYGRHTYGPQPQILGVMPWVSRKAVGSRVGNFCSISPGLKFSFLGKHNYHWITTYPFYELYDTWRFDNLTWHKGVPE